LVALAAVTVPFSACSDNSSTQPKADLTTPPPPNLPKDRQPPGAKK
jgi:hypothetical protein